MREKVCETDRWRERVKEKKSQHQLQPRRESVIVSVIESVKERKRETTTREISFRGKRKKQRFKRI